MSGDGEVTYPGETAKTLIPYATVTDTYNYYEIRNYVNDISRSHTQVLSAYDEKGTVRESYTCGKERLDYKTGETTYYYGYTGTGSVAQLTDPAGNLQTLYRYDPSGNVKISGAVDTGNPYQYNGEYTDAATGNAYLRARYYDAGTGSFLSEDSYLGSLLEPLSRNLYTYAENNPVNFADPSGHGIASWAKAKISSAKKAVTSAVTKVKTWAGNTVSKVKTAVSKAVSKVKTTVSNVVSKAKTAVSKAKTTVSNAYSKAKTTVSNAYTKAKTTISNTYTKAKTTVSNAYSKAKTWAQNTGETLHSWGKSKLKEADNILNSWTASVEKTVKHFCTTANRVKEDVVEFVKNIDWKKVAVGVGVTMAFTGVVLLSSGSAAPVLLSAAIGSGSGAVFNGVLTAMNGGSIADIAESASDGFMWGGIGGSLGGSTTVLLSELAAAGSSLIGNPFFQRLVQGAADTAVDTAQSASKGLPVTPEGIVVDMVYNTLMAGGIGSGGKQAVNEAVDETADSIGDSVRREVKSGGKSGSNSTRPNQVHHFASNKSSKYTSTISG